MTTVFRRLRAGQPSDTAEMNAAMRACDATLPPASRLIDDPYARLFVQRRGYSFLCSSRPVARLALTLFDRRYPGFLAEILLRARYFDDAVDVAHAAGIDQVVLLGAGYDCTALRHASRGLHVFEVDHPATQETKAEILRGFAPADAARVTFVPCDLESDALGEALCGHGFDPGRPCVIGWLGVSYYLRMDSFLHTLGEIAAVSAPPSRLVFDYLDTGVVAGTSAHAGALRAARVVARRGEPYTLGLSVPAVAEEAGRIGFRMHESVRVPELVARYAGPRPWCRDDDFMGVITLARTADTTG